MKIHKGIALLLATSSTVWAAVSLEITKGPVTGGVNAGPTQDPNAVQGQWFADGTVRQYEFHDNVTGTGGGVASSAAIKGVVTSITWSGAPGTSNIMAFTVDASITNDTVSWSGPWANGSNTHLEVQTDLTPYEGTMFSTVLVAEFALADLTIQPGQWALPYSQVLPEIVAINENTAAWYCYNNNGGNYYVPTWNFGNIAPGETASRSLQFSVNGAGIASTDSRYAALVASDLNDLDILSNRTTSLKISNWVDGIGIDDGTPDNVLLNSNASVFHVPEAGVTSLLGLVGFLALRRRR